MNERTLKITTEDGKEVECQILFTHHSEDFNKDYVVFYVEESNEASAAVYVPTESGEGRLEPVETDDEWAMLEDLLTEYSKAQENMEEASSGCSSCQGCNGSCDCDSEDCDCDKE